LEQNNYVRISGMMSNAAKSSDILITSLSVFYIIIFIA